MSRPSKQRRIMIRLSHSKAPAQARPSAGARRPAGGDEQPHWTVRFVFGVYLLAIVWTSVTYAAGHGFAASPMVAAEVPMRSNFTSSLTSSLTSKFTPGEPLNVPAYVQTAARAAGVNPRIAEWIVSHESRHHPDALGDNGQSRGIWQINRVYHPDVSDACAYDVRCSTDWSLRRIQDGYVNEWTTWKYCREWYADCPF